MKWVPARFLPEAMTLMLLKAEPAPELAALDVEEHRPPSGGPRPVRISGPRRAMFARIMVCVIIALTLAMTGVVYWRWATVSEPDLVFAIIGDPSQEGTRVTVTDDAKHSWSVTMTREEGFVASILLQEGHYHVTVVRHKETLLDDDIVMRTNHLGRLELPIAVRLIGDGKQDEDVHVTFDDGGEIWPAFRDSHLSGKTKFRRTIYLPPNRYLVTASRNGQVLSRRLLVVERGKEARQDLSKPPPDPDAEDGD
jgi:hypothetical protein